MSEHDPRQLVYVIDDDEAVRDSMGMLLESADLPYRCFASADDFIADYVGSQRGCRVLKLAEIDSSLPIIFITGHGDVPMAVKAMRQGAFDFLRKPVDEDSFLDRIANALDQETGDWHQKLDREQARERIAALSEREQEVFRLVAEGYANKAVAAELVEVHRSQVMKKLDARTLAQLVRIYLQSE
jgi:FixJ family two-component response regulator